MNGDMIGLSIGLFYSNAGEWFIHRYVLHGLGRNKQSLWSFHGHDHHRAYRRGRYCVYAIDAIALLRKNAFRAVRFEDSVPQWREAGLTIERGADDRNMVT
jgi:hypothetical protein